MNIDYFMKIQNAYGTKNKREKELAKVNREMSKHFEDTYDTEDVLLNDKPFKLMIIKDTDGNVFKKKIKARHNDKFNLGDYVIWNNQTWLITLLDPDNKTWCRGYMFLCTVPLRWQNSEGKIIERFAYSENFTKYSSGVTGNDNITIGDNQYGLILPVDNETKKLKRDLRFSIDFDDSEEPDTYVLTNRKVKLNDNYYFGRGATMILTLSFDAFNKKTDKKIFMEDGREVWICNYNNFNTSLPPTVTVPNEMTDLRAVISGDTNLRNSYKRHYTVTFTDKDGNAVDWNDVDYQWTIISDFEVGQTMTDNKITLFVNNEDLIQSSFLLQIIVENVVLSEVRIHIVE